MEFLLFRCNYVDFRWFLLQNPMIATCGGDMDKRKRGITHTRIQRLLWIFPLPNHVTLVDRGVLKQLQLVTQPLDIRH